MLNLLKKTLITASAALLISGAAQADINKSLQSVCSNAKQQDSAKLNDRLKDVQGSYKTKLANYYTGVSCSGKNLIHTAMFVENKPSGGMVNRKTLK